ncbi:hypothetical protein CYMTET_17827 [Cymbomonas tetramitiformis]|uniref:Glycosyl transferase CAP10 domain-containing protein n=1 Tax=Cymbomonas tetramitiformis TaxID=36881 RepID=A0AAE0G9C7_9CHLO|nr:hypothetical protein CYMTET_17827 [Cymbomonas tetramitiformis]
MKYIEVIATHFLLPLISSGADVSVPLPFDFAYAVHGKRTVFDVLQCAELVRAEEGCASTFYLAAGKGKCRCVLKGQECQLDKSENAKGITVYRFGGGEVVVDASTLPIKEATSEAAPEPVQAVGTGKVAAVPGGGSRSMHRLGRPVENEERRALASAGGSGMRTEGRWMARGAGRRRVRARSSVLKGGSLRGQALAPALAERPAPNLRGEGARGGVREETGMEEEREEGEKEEAGSKQETIWRVEGVEESEVRHEEALHESRADEAMQAVGMQDILEGVIKGVGAVHEATQKVVSDREKQAVGNRKESVRAMKVAGDELEKEKKERPWMDGGEQKVNGQGEEDPGMEGGEQKAEAEEEAGLGTEGGVQEVESQEEEGPGMERGKWSARWNKARRRGSKAEMEGGERKGRKGKKRVKERKDEASGREIEGEVSGRGGRGRRGPGVEEMRAQAGRRGSKGEIEEGEHGGFQHDPAHQMAAGPSTAPWWKQCIPSAAAAPGPFAVPSPQGQADGAHVQGSVRVMRSWDGFDGYRIGMTGLSQEAAAAVAVDVAEESTGTHLAPGVGALEAWIDEDLARGGWDKTGIHPSMIKAASELGIRTVRVSIIGGKLMGKITPTNKAVARGMSRVWYWMWGLLELLERFPGQVPDVDIAMQVEDTPKVPTLPHTSPQIRRRLHMAPADNS